MNNKSKENRIIIEPLQKSHINRMFFNLMDQLSSVPFDTADIDVDKHWGVYQSQINCHSLVVLEDNLLIGFGTILIEHKIRDSRVGHIEDIIIDSHYRGKDLGRKLIEKLLSIGKQEDCYKTTLSCYDNNIVFYEKLGFISKGNQMDFFYQNN